MGPTSDTGSPATTQEIKNQAGLRPAWFFWGERWRWEK